MTIRFLGAAYQDDREAWAAANEWFSPGVELLLVQWDEENQALAFCENMEAHDLPILGEQWIVDRPVYESWAELDGWHGGPKHAPHPIMIVDTFVCSEDAKLFP